VIVEPPFEVGAVKEMVALALPAVAMTELGEPGTVVEEEVEEDVVAVKWLPEQALRRMQAARVPGIMQYIRMPRLARTGVGAAWSGGFMGLIGGVRTYFTLCRSQG
jgi:hypothetical protein